MYSFGIPSEKGRYGSASVYRFPLGKGYRISANTDTDSGFFGIGTEVSVHNPGWRTLHSAEPGHSKSWAHNLIHTIRHDEPPADMQRQFTVLDVTEHSVWELWLETLLYL